MNYPIKTIADAEARISIGLARLRTMARHDEDAAYALSMIAPAKRRTVVQLEEDGRKKRNTASISNWNHDTGEVVLYFEPEEEQVEETSAQSAPRAAGWREATDAVVPATVASVSEEQVKQCCLSLAEAEKAGKPFIALTWFRDSCLAGQPYEWAQIPFDRARVLNQAIQQGLIDTQALSNPKNPSHPTTTVRINREKARHIVGSRFRPIPLRGEPLSAMIIRDRG